MERKREEGTEKTGREGGEGGRIDRERRWEGEFLILCEVLIQSGRSQFNR